MFTLTPNAYRKRERLLVLILVYGFAICVLRRRREERGRARGLGDVKEQLPGTRSRNFTTTNGMIYPLHDQAFTK